MSRQSVLLTITTFSIVSAMPAYAYLDPGTGSLIIQGIIGAIAAIGVTAKVYWHKLRIFFGGESNEPVVGEENNESSEKT